MFIIPADGVARVFDSHWVLHVQVNSGESFAIDITGAQFGWHEKMYEWDVYLQHRGTFVHSVEFGSWAGHWWPRMMAYESNTIERQTYELRKQICTATEVALKAFLALKHSNVLSLVSTPDAAAFSAQKTELVDRAVSYIKETIHKLTVMKAMGRWYMEVRKLAPGKFTSRLRVVDEESFAKKRWRKPTSNAKKSRNFDLSVWVSPGSSKQL